MARDNLPAYSLKLLRIVQVLIVLCTILPASAAATPRYAFGGAEKQYRIVRKVDPRVRDLARWEAAADAILAYVEKNPRGEDVPQALFSLGRLYEHTYRKRKSRAGLTRAVFFFEQLAKEHPGHVLADDALLSLGDLRREGLRNEVAARAAYYEIIDIYPQGDMIPQAKQRLGLDKIPRGTARGLPESSSKGEAEKSDRQRESDETERAKKAPAKTAQKTPQGLTLLAFDEERPQSKEIYVKKKTSQTPLIAIDPGHGGDDLGAIGPAGVSEKDVVLNIALVLDELLRERLRARTVLTRARDVAMELGDRTKIANNHEADLFISIHTNATPRKRASGVETYYLDNTDDKSSLRLAEQENKSLSMAGGDLGFMISDLIQNAKLDESISLAHYVQNALVKRLSRYYPDVNDLGVKKAPFYVLVGAHMPCVLAEVSFIDHPVEGKRLVSRRYQKIVAEALYLATREYFERHGQ